MDWQLDIGLQEKLLLLVREGYMQSEILHVASKEFQQYAWSERTLKRRLRHFGIKKHDPTITANTVISCIRSELQGPGKLLGYRAMYNKIRKVHGLQVKQKQIRLAMRYLDPDGVEERKLVKKRNKFRRRVFTSKGPNWVWSVDGHDKLMGWHKSEFPLAVHGCVDTFSRKILWLKAWSSNSSPKLPVRFYSDVVRESRVVPHFVRSDRGNENTSLYAVHNFLRQTPDGSSYVYGSSITNQVIERWWRDLRERNGNYFRSLLDSLTSTGLYNCGDETCRVILATLLVPVLQQELDVFKDCWNSHRIRRQDIRRPCGIPNFLYHHPESFGCASAGFEIDEERLAFVEEKLSLSDPIPFVSPEEQECILRILKKANLLPVTLSNVIDAYTLIYSGCKDRGVKLQFQKI